MSEPWILAPNAQANFFVNRLLSIYPPVGPPDITADVQLLRPQGPIEYSVPAQWIQRLVASPTLLADASTLLADGLGRGTIVQFTSQDGTPLANNTYFLVSDVSFQFSSVAGSLNVTALFIYLYNLSIR